MKTNKDDLINELVRAAMSVEFWRSNGVRRDETLNRAEERLIKARIEVSRYMVTVDTSRNEGNDD